MFSWVNSRFVEKFVKALYHAFLFRRKLKCDEKRRIKATNLITLIVLNNFSLKVFELIIE